MATISTIITALLAEIESMLVELFTGEHEETPSMKCITFGLDDGGDVATVDAIAGAWNPAWDAYKEDDDCRADRVDEMRDEVTDMLQGRMEELEYGDILEAPGAELDTGIWMHLEARLRISVSGKVTCRVHARGQDGLVDYLIEAGMEEPEEPEEPLQAPAQVLTLKRSYTAAFVPGIAQ